MLSEYRKNPYFLNEDGYKKLSAYISRDHDIIANKKRVYRVCKENGLLLNRRRKKYHRQRKLSTYREILKPNHLWQFDIKYGYIHGENRFFFVCAFIDIFTRKIIDYHVGLRCTAEDILTTLKFGLNKAQISEEDDLYIRSDNGPQMSSKLFSKSIENLPLEHEFIPIRSPNLNAYVESFFSTLETSLLSCNKYLTYGEAYNSVVNFIEFYNSSRIHGSIRMAPNDFYDLWKANKVPRNYAVSA